MRTSLPVFLACLLVVVACATARPAAPVQEPTDFREAFALAADRAQPLQQLLPGSADWSFYTCLHLQNEGRLDEAATTLKEWMAHHDGDPRVEMIQDRQALLGFHRDPGGTWEYLRWRLGLGFEQQRELEGGDPDLPSRLDPGLLAPTRLHERARLLHEATVAGFTDSGLERVDASKLSPEQRADLLRRLTRPDRDDLAQLVVEDLRQRQATFGSLPIHGRLLLHQLEECARLQPSLFAERSFIETWAARLAPGDDEDPDQDDAARDAWIARLEAFTERLPAGHNSFKAHVRYHRLAFELAHGRVDLARLLAYLKLPQQSPLRNATWIDAQPGGALVDVDRECGTGLPAIDDDDELLRACLLEVFRDMLEWEPLARYLDADVAGSLFAESKLLFGRGEPESWYALLGGPGRAEALRTRVELDFAPTQPRFFGPRDAVHLDLDLKHVDALLVRVFEIDAFNVYTQTGREVDASLDLDGLVANVERRLTYSDPPLRRERRRLELPELSRPGTWVVELVAEGLASRAVIHKGRLQHVVRAGAAGHVFRVLDDDGRPLADAAVWMAGQLYRADAQGDIAVPYSTDGGQRTIVLVHGERATLASFEHLEESYALAAGVLVDREALLAHGTARLLVRPALRVNGRPASLSLLEDPRLTLTATDHDGVVTVEELRDLVLTSDGELVHELQVPDRLARLQVGLSGRVANLSLGRDDELAAPDVEFRVSAIRETLAFGAALLGRTPDGFVLDVLGLSGEPLAGRAVPLVLALRDVREELRVTLRTDAAGRLQLGALDGVTALSVEGFSSTFNTWNLSEPSRTWPASLHAAAGSVLRVPAPAGLVLERAAVSLLELRQGQTAIDRFGQLALRDGVLELRDLPPGSFDLLFKDLQQHVRLELTAGESQGGWIVGRHRVLPETPLDLLHVSGLVAEGDQLVIRLAQAGPGTRVHVLATRWLPPFAPLDALDVGAGWQARSQPRPSDECAYQAGRALSDEQRYVLDRRQARKFPGNMLRRPTLLLNPWELAESESGAGGAAAGGGFGGGRAAKSIGAGGASTARAAAFGLHPGLYADLGFLPSPSVTLANLRPDAEGVVRVPRADLGPGHLVHVVALDDESTEVATLVLPEMPLAPRDVALDRAFAADRHLAELRRIEFLPAGAVATVAEASTAQAEVIDSLGDVLRLFAALGGGAELARFDFLARWPALPREERLALLSDHGCHELHLFVHEHDPQLFDEVLRPYLRNKLDKTFLDHWLLEDDLSPYLEPWLFDQLNVMERILLARWLPEAAPAVTRALIEGLALRAPDPEAERRRFDAALRGSALDAGTSFGDEVRRVGAYSKGPAESSGPRAAQGVNPGGVGAPGPGAGVDDVASGSSGILTAKGRLEAERDAVLRESLRPLYREPDPTRAYVEHNYWHRRIGEQDADLLPLDRFWLDFAQTAAGAPFVSPHVAEATGNLNEMLLALALLDLPFESAEHERLAEGGALTLRAGGPLLLVSRQIEDAAPASEASPVFVGQDLFHLEQAVAPEGGTLPRPVTGDLRTAETYASRVVVTNPSAVPQRVSVLQQVPQGAIPVGPRPATLATDLQLGPWETQALETHFYFPRAGDFAHWPAHLTRDGTLLASAAPATRHVVAGPGAPDTGSWNTVSQQASDAELWAFLQTANLQSLDLDRMAWRLQDAAFFRAALDWFGRRHVYVPVVWSFGLKHEDVAAAREYLRHRADFVARCGPALSSPLLDIDPVECRFYEHVEFEPLVNARAHPLRGRHLILNEGLAAQYGRLMDVLAFRPRLDDQDWLSVTYFMLLQDRVEDALAAFARVDAEALPGRLQHDLITCYLGFYGSDPQGVRGLAESHADHPLPRWRERFREVLDHLDEAAGRPRPGEPGDADTLAASEPSLELELQDGSLMLRHANLASCELRWFRMDAELLFSRDPFGEQDTSTFATIRPVRSDAVTLEPGAAGTTVELPAEFRDANVLVEARGAGLVRRVARYASALAVTIIEARGQLHVVQAGTDVPLSGAYVKVFSRGPEGVRFHKDGYTDLRGRFDYASVSGQDSSPQRFAILVLSDEAGTVIRQVDPPAR